MPGYECFFYDQLAGEQLGEFPSMWDLVEGECEIAKVNGENVIAMYSGCHIKPLMKTDNYLGETYTVEFDYYDNYENDGQDYGYIEYKLCKSGSTWLGDDNLAFSFDNYVSEWAFTGLQQNRMSRITDTTNGITFQCRSTSVPLKFMLTKNVL